MRPESPQHGAGKSWIAAGLLAACVLYPASFGPSCWMAARGSLSPQIVSYVYQPLLQVAARFESPHNWLVTYANYGSDGKQTLIMPGWGDPGFVQISWFDFSVFLCPSQTSASTTSSSGSTWTSPAVAATEESEDN